jgi:hypothetical protein
MEIPLKTKNRTTIWSNNSTAQHESEECTSGYNKHICTSLFIAALLTVG